MTDTDAVPEFWNGFRKLVKKYPSLQDDLGNLIKVIKTELPNPPREAVLISGLGECVHLPIYKITKFRCRSIGHGKKSGLRIIYTYFEDEDMIIFIEIYAKSKKSNHDIDRIKKYFEEQAPDCLNPSPSLEP